MLYYSPRFRIIHLTLRLFFRTATGNPAPKPVDVSFQYVTRFGHASANLDLVEKWKNEPGAASRAKFVPISAHNHLAAIRPKPAQVLSGWMDSLPLNSAGVNSSVNSGAFGSFGSGSAFGSGGLPLRRSMTSSHIRVPDMVLSPLRREASSRFHFVQASDGFPRVRE